MVRLTFKMRSYARADKPRRVIARSSICSLSESIRQWRRIIRGVIAALAKIFSPAKRRSCCSLAAITRVRIVAELSVSGDASPVSSRNFTAGTSM